METLYDGTTEELSEVPLISPISTESLSRVEFVTSNAELPDTELRTPKKQKSNIKSKPPKLAVRENMLENILSTATSALDNLNSQPNQPSTNQLFGQ